MPLRLGVKRKLLARSDRIKSVDLHPAEQWMLVSLYSGKVHIWNYENQQLVKSFEVCDLPVRAARFVARKNWVITGSDDMQIRVFNYNTLERVHNFEAHSDYLRSIAVHHTQPFLLTSSDDMLIKLWDWDNKWQLKQTFEGHTHYVMQLVINPKDNNTFATASLDKTIKVWQFGSPTPNFTLEGHEKGVNCVDYYHGDDKPYLISGADDRLIKIWDYQNQTCVATLDGHDHYVSAVCFHPDLPIIITGSEDSTIRIWHANTNRLETTLNYGLERVWCISALKGSNTVAIGYDEGSVTINLGKEEPTVSMDSSGMILWAKDTEIQQANLKTIDSSLLESLQDGERISLSVKDMGSCEICPQTLQHSPNGQFVVACGDGEYIIYTSTALRNKASGSGLEFVWASDPSMYAVRESSAVAKVFANFKEHATLRPDIIMEGIDGGPLLTARSSTSLCFYDWKTLQLIRPIEIAAKKVYWSGNGDLVAIAAEESFYILKYNAEAVSKANLADVGPDGVEDAFEVISEQAECVKTGFWIEDCFIFTTSLNRLSYYMGGGFLTVAHLDRTLYLLGFKDDRIYACDKDHNIVSYKLLLTVLEYQTAVMRRNFFDSADKILRAIPEAQRTRVAHFLEKQGFKQQALAVSCDQDHRFDLALSLGDLNTAFELAQLADSEEKLKQLTQDRTATKYSDEERERLRNQFLECEKELRKVEDEKRELTLKICEVEQTLRKTEDRIEKLENKIYHECRLNIKMRQLEDQLTKVHSLSPNNSAMGDLNLSGTSSDREFGLGMTMELPSLWSDIASDSQYDPLHELDGRRMSGGGSGSMRQRNARRSLKAGTSGELSSCTSPHELEEYYMHHTIKDNRSGAPLRPRSRSRGRQPTSSGRQSASLVGVKPNLNSHPTTLHLQK